MSAGKTLRRLFIFDPPDPVGFWRARAARPGYRSVLWANEVYNQCAHDDHWRTIERYLPERRGAVLDLGCGTGRFSAQLAARFEQYTGVDLDAMIVEARRRHPALAFVPATVMEYTFPAQRFDLVLSMACLASSSSASEFSILARRIVEATRPGGRIIMIDPFHRSPILARVCRLSGRDVVALFSELGAEVVEWSGVHCLPLRLLLAGRATLPVRVTRMGYRVGEAINRLAPRWLSDYKVIVLSKPPIA